MIYVYPHTPHTYRKREKQNERERREFGRNYNKYQFKINSSNF